MSTCQMPQEFSVATNLMSTMELKVYCLKQTGPNESRFDIPLVAPTSLE